MNNLKTRSGVYSYAAILYLSIILLLSACGGATPVTGDFKNDISLDKEIYTFESLSIPDGVTVTLKKGSTLNISGNADIQGAIVAEASKLALNVDGDLNLNGDISISESSGSSLVGQQISSTALKDQTEGLFLVVKGNLTMGSNSKVNASGPTVFTDDAAELNKTIEEINDEADTASGDLTTIVPLEPTDPAFTTPQIVSTAIQTQQNNITWTITGDWDYSDSGITRSTVLFRVNNADLLSFENWDLTAPAGPSGEAEDNSQEEDKGKDAKGKNGKRGLSVNISNNSGNVALNNSTINLASGGDGGSANTNCANATGGNGAKAGNFRASAKGSISLQGNVTINPGRGGHGGDATATGDGSCDVEATGGKGSDNEKQLFVRGNVAGLENLSFGNLAAGNGGTATARTEGTAADATSCGATGEAGGNATATGGQGGNASLTVSNTAIGLGAVQGGNAGDGTAKAGDGGDGGDCSDGSTGGVGGDGGKATASGGNGGTGDASGGSGGSETDGTAGNASATAGNAGRGGHSCGTPQGTGGAGGTGGTASATAGTGGDGTTRGTTAGSGGNGGKGGDGATPGKGGSKGEGTGSPNDISDGADGADGGLCTTKVSLLILKDGSGEGTVSTDPPASDTEDGKLLFPIGTTVTVTATPASGSVFVNYTGDCTGKSCQLTMDSDKTITAVFEQESSSSDIFVSFDHSAIPVGFRVNNSCEDVEAKDAETLSSVLTASWEYTETAPSELAALIAPTTELSPLSYAGGDKVQYFRYNIYSLNPCENEFRLAQFTQLTRVILNLEAGSPGNVTIYAMANGEVVGSSTSASSGAEQLTLDAGVPFDYFIIDAQTVVSLDAITGLQAFIAAIPE